MKFWKRWYFWATHSRLQPMIDAAKLIARHLPNVLTYFKHRITNAVAEGLNSKIATVQKRACGFGIRTISRSPSTSIAADSTYIRYPHESRMNGEGGTFSIPAGLVRCVPAGGGSGALPADASHPLPATPTVATGRGGAHVRRPAAES